jgi:hypothetical protein
MPRGLISHHAGLRGRIRLALDRLIEPPIEVIDRTPAVSWQARCAPRYGATRM